MGQVISSAGADRRLGSASRALHGLLSLPIFVFSFRPAVEAGVAECVAASLETGWVLEYLEADRAEEVLGDLGFVDNEPKVLGNRDSLVFFLFKNH